MDYLINFRFTSSLFYCLPKVHKSKIIKNVRNTENFEYTQVHCPDDLKWRPISGGPESPTQRLSNLIEISLKPLACTLKSYIKDVRDFLGKLPTKVPFDSTMYSCDILSLYTSIPTELGIEEISLGTKCAPLYVCLTVGYLKEKKIFTNDLPKCFNESECKLSMELLKCSMDDAFIFWPLKLNFENFKTR